MVKKMMTLWFVLALATPAFAGGVIKIGAMYPLSGRAADLGVSCEQGAQLAVNQINAKGGVLGKKLELLSSDSKANTQEAVSISQRYILKDKVNFLFGTVSSAAVLAVAQVARENKTIFMATVASTDTLTTTDWNRYTFRSGTCNSQEANSLALYTPKSLTRFYTIGPNYEYGHTMWAIYKAKIAQVNPKAQFIGEQWPKLFEPDYTPYINAILAAKPDAVFCSLWGGDLVAFIQQAKPYGLFKKMKWIMATGADISYTQPLGKNMPTGLIVDQRYYFYWPETARNREFVKAYRAAYHNYPGEAAGEGYDGVYFLADAMKKAKSTDTDKVIKELEGLTINSPRGKATLRKQDHQMVCDFMVGETTFTKAYPFAITGNDRVFAADEVIYPLSDWEKAQAAKK